MKLYIAEKPSLGKAIAEALPKPLKSHKGYIEASNGDLVSWCIGHILEQANPEHYQPEFKRWRLEHLPIIPKTWQLKPKYQTRSQITILRTLVKKASEIIHAGDPDREGQLLVDEVIDYLKVSQTKKANIKRLLISDLNLSAVKKSLTQLKNNQDFMPLSISALARSRADWLYGINITRAYTLQGQKAGFNGVLSVGRVQTPILALVVKRDEEISHFQPTDYFEVLAHITVADTPAKQQPQSFSAKWQPSEACAPYMDEHGHVLNKALAENVIARIKQQPALVEKALYQDKKQPAPLPYSLSSLQIDAAKQFSMNAKLVLDVCQALYEKHKLITYPRSDCRYLPVDHFKQAKTLIDNIAKSDLPLAKLAQQADHRLKSKAWNNSKITAHHAIIPTEKSPNKSNLNPFEKNVYSLISRQYLAQFFPANLFQQQEISLLIAGGTFIARAKTEQEQGWKALFQSTAAAKEKQFDHNDKSLPKLKKGDSLHCEKGELLAKTTQPPKAFTDATLLAALTGIARFVKSPEIKKILKETDGLGTEATRAGIIELLFKRSYLKRTGKQIQATDIGKALIKALPEQASLPDMTANWEAMLNNICNKTMSYQNFMQPLTETITDMIAQSQQQNFQHLPKMPFKAKRKRKSYPSKKTATA
ncbi:MAG: DNA topoisomerase III [Thalassotalea sp.]